jgi:hypothetical protein
MFLKTFRGLVICKKINGLDLGALVPRGFTWDGKPTNPLVKSAEKLIFCAGHAASRCPTLILCEENQETNLPQAIGESRLFSQRYFVERTN